MKFLCTKFLIIHYIGRDLKLSALYTRCLWPSIVNMASFKAAPLACRQWSCVGAGLVVENWRVGRHKHMWVSIGSDLRIDTRRDLDDAGAHHIPVHPLNKLPYGTLASKKVRSSLPACDVLDCPLLTPSTSCPRQPLPAGRCLLTSCVVLDGLISNLLCETPVSRKAPLTCLQR